MGQERRRYERFPVVLTARRKDVQNKNIELKISELSIGGCFTGSFPEGRVGHQFKMEIPLIDNSWLSFDCKVRYRFLTFGLGIEFVDVTEVQKEALADVIMKNLWGKDLPPNAPLAPPASIDNPRKLEFA